MNSSSSVATLSSTESKESEAAASHLACEESGFEAASSVGLRIHISKKYEEIPQLDGESSYESDTDCWWINQQNGCLPGTTPNCSYCSFTFWSNAYLQLLWLHLLEQCLTAVIVASTPGAMLNCSYGGFTSWSNA